MENVRFELSLEDVVKIGDAAEKMGCTIESLLIEAATDKRLLYVKLLPHSPSLAAIPSHENPKKGKRSTRSASYVALLPHYADLLIDGSAEVSQYQAGYESPLDWHFWMLDKPQTVEIDRIYFPKSDLIALPENQKIKKKKTRIADNLTGELYPILAGMQDKKRRITAGTVMHALKKLAGSKNSCVLDDIGDGVRIDTDNGTIDMNNRKLQKRIDTWLKNNSQPDIDPT